jgi:enamine deaminase RidA (YjgF/YER057c/UK114 family)
MTKSIIEKNKFYTLYTVEINEQTFITVSVNSKDADPLLVFSEAYTSIVGKLNASRMDIVLERIFGNISFYNGILNSRKVILKKNGYAEDLPFTFIQGQPVWGKGIAGIQITAINTGNSEKGIRTIYDDGIPCGRAWRSDGATFLMLQNIYNYKTNGIKQEEDSCVMFDRAEKILKENGGSYRNVVRTWIYLADILSWYSEFNHVRNEKYKEYGFLIDQTSQIETEKIYLPASTGILGYNPFGAGAVMDILAIIPQMDNKIKFEQVSGKKQKSAFRYGSAFSRAMKIIEPGITTILLSGTASIDEAGHTVYVDDTKKQIIKTMEVVEALVGEEKENISIKNICSSTIFLKKPEYYKIYQEVSKECGLEDVPAVFIVADVCREELLFEIDATFACET